MTFSTIDTPDILVDWLLYDNYRRLIEILPCEVGNLHIFKGYHYKKTKKLDLSRECYKLLLPQSTDSIGESSLKQPGRPLELLNFQLILGGDNSM